MKSSGFPSTPCFIIALQNFQSNCSLSTLDISSWDGNYSEKNISYLQMTSLVCSLLLSMMDLYMITPSVASVSSPQETRMM